jgi:LysR family glycine cleavage system transcriptional activator
MPAGSLPPLGAVRVFEAAARHQIKLLKERLGTPLFLRLPRRVELTEAGARLAPAVSTALGALRAAFAEAQDDTRGALSISSLHIFASNWLAPRLGAFAEARPGISVELNVSNHMTDFTREEVDAGIRSGLGPWPGLEGQALLRVRFAPLCSPDLLRRAGSIDSPADLLRLPLLSPHDPWWARWLELAGVPTDGLAARGGFRFDSQQIEGNAAIAGQGVAILTPALWTDELARGRLVQPFPLVGDEGRFYWLVYPASRRGSRKIRAFRDWLLAEVQHSFPAEELPPQPAQVPSSSSIRAV